MHDCAVEMIGEERTARAAFFPAGAQHKVIHHQLILLAEELRESLLAVRAFENVILLHLFPRQFPALAADIIALAREFFFARQKFLARCYPFVMRNHFVLL